MAEAGKNQISQQAWCFVCTGKKKQELQKTVADYTRAVTNSNEGIQTITNTESSTNWSPEKQQIAEKMEIKGKNDTEAKEAKSTSSKQDKTTPEIPTQSTPRQAIVSLSVLATETSSNKDDSIIDEHVLKVLLEIATQVADTRDIQREGEAWLTATMKQNKTRRK